MAEGPERLSIVVFDGSFARVHYAFVLASAAAATNRQVTLLFSGRALHALARGDGWTRLDGDAAGDAAAQEAALAARGLATLQELRGACADLGVRFLACELGLRSLDLFADSLDPALNIEVAGVVTFLETAPNAGCVLFI